MTAEPEGIRIYYRGGPRLTKSFYAALGQVAQGSASLEAAVRELLAHLMKSNAGRVIGAGESMTNLLALCQRVVAFDHSLTDDQVTTLNQLVKAIQPIQDSRNAVIHARWYSTDTPRHFYGSRSRRPQGTSANGLSEDLFMTLDHLLQLAANLDRARQLVDEFRLELSNGRHLTSGLLSRQVMKGLDEDSAKFAEEVVRDAEGPPSGPHRPPGFASTHPPC